jgi:hypothetical protein
MNNHNKDSTFKVSDSQPASVVRAKPTIKVRINPRPKAEADHSLILQGLARLNLNISNLSELVSKLLKQQHYAEIRERERRW